MKTLRTTCGIWILSFFLFLPFPYSFLPNFGEVLSEVLFPIVKLIGFLFGTELAQSNFHSDSIHLYLQLLTTLLLSAIVANIIVRIKSINQERFNIILHTTASYILALFLLKYGCDKLFKYQFYDGAPNTLFTPVGYLSKDILFWTSMGSSHSYNVFMGLIEIIPGLLLLSKKTRALGALIATAVLTNVLAINFGFDITVKILSTMLVITALYILEPHFKRLYLFFIQNSFTRPDSQEEIIKKPIVKRAIKGLLISLVILESLFSYVTADAWNADNLPKIKYYGSYSIIDQQGTSKTFDLENIRRLHIHNSGYLIIETKNGQFNDYKAIISNSSGHIKLVDLNLEMRVVEDLKTLTLISNAPRNQFRITTEKINLDSLPYHSDSFHWTVESFMED